MQKKRLGIVVFFFILFFVILIIRIVAVTLFPDKKLSSPENYSTPRGKIIDRNGKELAVASSAYSLYVRTDSLKKEMKDFLFRTWQDSGIFSPEELKRLYTQEKFIWVKRKLTPNHYQIINSLVQDLKKNGYLLNDEIGIVEEESRFYPYEAAANVVGLVGMDNEGLFGTEYTFDEALKQGHTLRLTIDAQLSTIAYEELKKTVLNYQAEYGSVAIIETSNREVLALVGYPSFNPNDTQSLTKENIKPKATAYNYEPGSVMKQFSAAYALEKGIATPNSPLFYCPDALPIGDHTFTGSANYGNVDLTQIIQKSLNVGMVQVAKRFTPNGFYDFLIHLGFGKKIDLPLTDVEAGLLRPTSRWSYLSKYMISIGQEMGTTTLQLALACSVVGGDGIFTSPKIVLEDVTREGKNVYQIDREPQRVMSSENTRKLLDIMKHVVSEDGTALKAKVEGIPIAGKTGTGQVARPGGGGYYPDLYNAVFTGYVPSDAPRFVIVVAINRPHHPVHTGGELAAPVFANIVRRMIISTPYFVR